MKILVVFGTRPEAIKMAPLVIELRKNPFFTVSVCVTAQHRQMLDQVLKMFSIEPEYDLDLMKDGQTLSDLTARVLIRLDSVFNSFKPDCVVVHGDTSTTFATTLAAYYHRVDVAHVEAGLRTGDIYSPWPEEINRRFTTLIAQHHFAPTINAAQNLINENVNIDRITTTGNTVIDALLMAKDLLQKNHELRLGIEEKFSFLSDKDQVVLVTGHRRENFGLGISQICAGILKLSRKFKNVQFVYPVHLNPNIQEPVFRLLSGHSNIHLIEPQEYLPFVYLMNLSYIILTDSGGIQEEAPALGKPVLVMRDNTERPEALTAGTAKLIGADSESIFSGVSELLLDTCAYKKMTLANNPYGDGSASVKIVNALVEYYNL
jgi:UDP-N-acetylglucosamine 2-epimerase (non-hydrolysing)